MHVLDSLTIQVALNWLVATIAPLASLTVSTRLGRLSQQRADQ